MKNLSQLYALIDARTQDLTELQRQQEAASGSTDVAERRRLRVAISEAQEDIAELDKDVQTIEAWERSPERAAQRQEGADLAAFAGRKQNEAKADWLALDECLNHAKEIAKRLFSTHAEIDAACRGAVSMQFADDSSSRLSHAALLAPLARGNTAGLSHAVAGALLSVLDALPVAGRVRQDYVTPNSWVTWPGPTIEAAFDATQREFATRIAEVTKEAKR